MIWYIRVCIIYTLCIGKCKREICRKCDPELGNYNNVRFAAMTARGARTFAKVRLLHNEMIVNIYADWMTI